MTKEGEKKAVAGGTMRVTVRMPSALHAALLKQRDETGQSLNDLLIEAAAKLLDMPIPQVRKGIPGRKPGVGKRGEEQR